MKTYENIQNGRKSMKTGEWEKYERDADTILDELINEANKEDTNVFAATTTEVSSESVPQSAPTSSLTLGVIRRYKEIQITRAPSTAGTKVNAAGLQLLEELLLSEGLRRDSLVYKRSDRIEAGTTSTNLTAKLPILNPRDYDLWLMRIEQYFLMIHYSFWEVIKNGNKVLKRTVRETEQEYEPTTTEEKQDRKNEMKARGTLLMALPNMDQLKFHSYKDAKLLMEAIEKSENMDVTTIVTPSNVKTVESNLVVLWCKRMVEVIPKDKTVSSSTEKMKLVKSARETVKKAMIHMPKGAKVIKDLLSHKEKLQKIASSVKLSDECLAVVQKSLPQKERDPGSFTLLYQWVDTVDHDGQWIETKEEQDLKEVRAISFYYKLKPIEPLEWKAFENQLKSSMIEPPKLALKELPEHLEYAFLQEADQLLVVISSVLSTTKKTKLLEVLRNHKGAIS
ncbi:hypothetical protein Tco_1376649 [Tanacetum coccineum]